MKTILLLLFCGIMFCYPWRLKPDLAASLVSATPEIPHADTISFKAQIEPIFQNHCNPCHFPGGKMYERLPFDRSETILEHKEGIAKRIKDEKEVKLLSLFYTQAGK